MQPATDPNTRLDDVAFRVLPLAAMAAVAALAAASGPGWTERLAPLPWLVSMVCVGLPHGAADFATSRSAWRGWSLAAICLAYVSVMAAVAVAFAAAPLVAIVVFALVSCWHFGTSHLDSRRRSFVPRPRTVAVIARGCAVLVMPLAAWPEATARVATELAALAIGATAASRLFQADAVRCAGLGLAALTLAATAAEGISSARRLGGMRDWLGLVIELAVIAALGWSSDPLFSVGLYFLAWHSWQQMATLAQALNAAPPRSWRHIGDSLALIHAAALPLLVPAWAMIAAVWWTWSPERSLRDLAVVSIAAYLVVTPAHELLCDLMRRRVGQRASGRHTLGPGVRTGAGASGSCPA